MFTLELTLLEARIIEASCVEALEFYEEELENLKNKTNYTPFQVRAARSSYELQIEGYKSLLTKLQKFDLDR